MRARHWKRMPLDCSIIKSMENDPRFPLDGRYCLKGFIYVLFRRRTFFLLIFPMIMLFVAKPSSTAFWIGLPFALIGEAIRIWSAGYLKKMDKLTTAGPFALCRNPLYVGSFVGSIGYFAMCNRIEVWIAGPILFWLFHGGAVAQEEGMLLDMFGDPFKEYCSRVPRFIPRSFNAEGDGEFSWSQWLNNHEYRGLLASLFVIGLFASMAFVFHTSPLQWLLRR